VNAQSMNDAVFFAAILNGYFPQDEDHPAAVEGVETAYYSFVNKEGEYYIIRDVVDGESVTHRYFKGTENYDTIWTGRSSLPFDVPGVVFK